MPFMSHPEHGYHQATGAEVEDMLKNGWIIDIPPHEKQKLASQPKVDILPERESQRRPGRPPKAAKDTVI